MRHLGVEFPLRLPLAMSAWTQGHKLKTHTSDVACRGICSFLAHMIFFLLLRDFTFLKNPDVQHLVRPVGCANPGPTYS